LVVQVGVGALLLIMGIIGGYTLTSLTAPGRLESSSRMRPEHGGEDAGRSWLRAALANCSRPAPPAASSPAAPPPASLPVAPPADPAAGLNDSTLHHLLGSWSAHVGLNATQQLLLDQQRLRWHLTRHPPARASPPGGHRPRRGILIVAGGENQLANALITVRVLREQLGCSLPIEVGTPCCCCCRHPLTGPEPTWIHTRTTCATQHAPTHPGLSGPPWQGKAAGCHCTLARGHCGVGPPASTAPPPPAGCVFWGEGAA
jgi:hypothetical protein